MTVTASFGVRDATRPRAAAALLLAAHASQATSGEQVGAASCVTCCGGAGVQPLWQTTAIIRPLLLSLYGTACGPADGISLALQSLCTVLPFRLLALSTLQRWEPLCVSSCVPAVERSCGYGFV
jgi:hypothetical protein